MTATRLHPALRLAFRRAAAAPALVSPLNFPLSYPSPCTKRSSIHISVSLSQSSQSSASSYLCRSCSRPLVSSIPACTNCWTIFPLSPEVTHHELFGLPYEPNPFVVDLTTLKQRFRKAQTACHPDTWTSQGPNKQVIAQALSSQVNEAYQALLRPLARAEYILSRNNSSVSEHDQLDDTAFIMEIMELREFIDDAEESSEVITLMEENSERINETIHQIDKLVGQRDWAGVKAATIRLRYLEGIARAVKKWLDNH